MEDSVRGDVRLAQDDKSGYELTVTLATRTPARVRPEVEIAGRLPVDARALPVNAWCRPAI